VSTVNLDSKNCYICYNPYRLDGVDSDDEDIEEPVQLPCGHIFGRSCIQRWMQESSSCPNCRTLLSDSSLCDRTSPHSESYPTADDWAATLGRASVQDLFDHLERNPLDESVGYMITSEEPENYREVIDSFNMQWNEFLGVDHADTLSDSFNDPVDVARALDVRGRQSSSRPRSVNYTRFAGSPSRQTSGFSNVPNHAYEAAQICPQTTSMPTSMFSVPNSPTVDDLLEQELADSDIKLGDLAESHNQWMCDLGCEAEFEAEDEDDGVCCFCPQYVLD
jgi:hypothetical protein